MKTLIYYLLLINLICFLLAGLDKFNSIHKYFRIPEKVFFILSFIGGSLGILIGMYLFHHKTKKMKFYLGIPFLFIINIISIYLIIKIK